MKLTLGVPGALPITSIASANFFWLLGDSGVILGVTNIGVVSVGVTGVSGKDDKDDKPSIVEDWKIKYKFIVKPHIPEFYMQLIRIKKNSSKII